MSQRICSVEDCGGTVKARGWCNRHYARWNQTGSLDLGVRPRGNFRKVQSLEERFWPKVRKTEGCWIWTGTKTTLGYGQIYSGPGGRHVGAHRVSWELANGRAVPTGLHIDHLCMNPPCVNPSHLEAVTVAENTRRGYAPSVGAATQRAKGHCPQGHPYDETNTYVSPDGRRSCRACGRESMRRSRAVEKETNP